MDNKVYYPLDIENPPAFYLAGTTARTEEALAKLGLTRTPVDFFEETDPDKPKELNNPDKALAVILEEGGEKLIELVNTIFRTEKNAHPHFQLSQASDIDIIVVKEAVFDFFYKDIKIMLQYLNLYQIFNSAPGTKK